MFSVLRNIWNSLDWGVREKQNAEKEFENEQKYFEDAVEKEIEIEKHLLATNTECSVFDSKQQNKIDKNIAQEQGKCFKATGKISSLNISNGTINNYIFFDIEDAKMLFNDLKVGSHVEFIAYQNSNSELTKIVKITQILDEHWDKNYQNENDLQNEIEKLQNENLTYFKTHTRAIIGLIIERQPETITIETENSREVVNLDNIETNFVPQKGDRIYMHANVRCDEDYIDKMGEILEVKKIEPTRLLKNERCIVKSVNNNWGVLNDDIYYLNETLITKVDLNEGDVVEANLIECEHGKFNFRCIDLNVIEKNDVLKKSTNKEKEKYSKTIATVDDDKWVIYNETFVTDTVIFTITNNRERDLTIKNISILQHNRKSCLDLIDPPLGKSFIIESLGKKELKFEITPRKYGEYRECFIITFEGFKIKRSITMSICENQKDAELLKLRKERNEYSPSQILNIRQENSLSYHYANQVWSNINSPLIPGVNVIQKRRFIHFRIGHYAMPTHLRTDYLVSETKKKMAENIYGSYPYLKEELNFNNYSRRFDVLIFLEEIQNFISFRKFDRERAHFQRDGEYLTLIMEDLAERRPSLVIGDSLHCINPWDIDNKSNRFEGCIHKIGRDRIFVKFNTTFQQQYNGEDYRVEFYYSRFNFRKLHHAVNFVPKKMGEQFLFPTKINLNDNYQLDVDLNTDENLVLKQNGEVLKWFNPILNIIQKHAVKNILRGEVKNMPYIIFGPPGTGKTITLVETILQILNNITSSRLIVATPSNSSADLISTYLVNSGVLKVGDFIRLVSQNQIEREAIPEHLKPYCGTIDIAIDGTCKDTMVVTDSGLKLKCQMKFLGRQRITISTCATIGNYIQLGFPENHFTHALIDEAGQCSEPELMIPLSLISAKRSQVIITGDPKQLPAIVCNDFAKANGLTVSFLERIIESSPYRKDRLRFPKSCGYDPRLITKLLYNYRSLPSIMNIYNNLFYDAELIPMISEKDSKEVNALKSFHIIQELFESNKRSKTHAAFFTGILSNNQQESDSPSWYNAVEAKRVFITVIQFYRNHLLPENIGIITPYIKQVKHLRNLFNVANITAPKIGTVEEFQGQERDVILISTVRSSKEFIDTDLRFSLGFVKCPKRMNVAISRARYLLLVFGNPNILMHDSSWRAYIKYCIDNDAYTGCDIPLELINELDESDKEDEMDKTMKDRENYILNKSITKQNIEIELENKEAINNKFKINDEQQQKKENALIEKTKNKKLNELQQIEDEEKSKKSINKYFEEEDDEENDEKFKRLIIEFQEEEEKKLKTTMNKSKEMNEIMETPKKESKEKEYLIKTPMGVIKTTSPLQKENKSKVLFKQKQEESDSDVSINNELQYKSKDYNKKKNEQKRRTSYKDEGQERFNFIMENGYTSDLEEQWF